MTTTASVIDVISIADLVSPTSTLTVTPASAGGATSFAGLTGTWSLAQVDGSGGTNTFLRADKAWAQVTFPVIGGTLALSQISSSGATSGYAIVWDGTSITWAPAASTPTSQTNTTSGTVLLVRVAWRRVWHKATGATTYRLPAAPSDGDVIQIRRAAAGTGTVSLDGNGHNIERMATSASTWGPSARVGSITATYVSADSVWRLS